jgi:hypothetical protein
MKDILDTAMSSSYLDQNLEIDSEGKKLEAQVSLYRSPDINKSS